MGGRTGDSASSSSSSIVLLQERFKKLQQAREVRQEQELSKKLAELARVNPIVFHEPSGLSFNNEYPYSPQSAQYYHRTDHHLQVNREPKYGNSPYTTAGMGGGTQVYVDDDDSDVDTSLHL
ncbi:hypothetical protein QQ045_007122 [Rhodiola kirilowii]